MYMCREFRLRFKKSANLVDVNIFRQSFWRQDENPCLRICNLQDEKVPFQENLLRDENSRQKIWLPQADSQPTGALSKRKSSCGGHIKKRNIVHFNVRGYVQPTVCNLFPLSYLSALEMNCRQPEHAAGVKIFALISKRRS